MGEVEVAEATEIEEGEGEGGEGVGGEVKRGEVDEPRDRGRECRDRVVV